MIALALTLGLLGAVSAAGTPAHDGTTLQPEVRASLVAKILDYDRTAAAAAADGFRIGVVFDPANEDSRAEKALMVEALREERIRVAGVQAEIVDIPIGRLASDARALDVAYLCAGLDPERVVAGFAAAKPLTFVDSEELLGVAAVALVPRNGRPRIIVHLAALAAENVVLDARLLQLAETVGGAAAGDAPRR